MKAAHSLLCLAALLRSAVPVSLRVEPGRCLFVKGEPVSFSCEGSAQWAVVRTTSAENVTVCGEDWGRRTGSVCKITGLISFESGLYWCQSEDGLRSAALNISVTDKLKPNVSATCAPPPSTAVTTTPTVPAPLPPLPTLPPRARLLWSVLGCGLGSVLVVVLVLLGLTVKRCRRRTEQNGRPEEITYSEIRLSHGHRRPIKCVQEPEQSPVYSAVKTRKDIYSTVTRTKPGLNQD